MTEETKTTTIVGVRFSKVGKIYHFDASRLEILRIGDVVVVETSRGWQLGEIAEFVRDTANTNEGPLKLLDRLATPKDLIQRQSWQVKEPDVIEVCKTRVKDLKLSGVKVIMCEYSFDGTHLTIFFSSDSEDKVELKSLRPDMQKAFAPTQVDLRQIGPRDVAKYMGGMGACGLESRCCSRFITEFNSISIRMAKEQGISLTPTEITGMCGRLRCCLIYEYDNYVEARKLLPKKNKRVKTPEGEGKVLDVSPIRECVMVDLPEKGRREYHISEITVLDDGESGAKAPQPSGSRGGGCPLCNG